MVQRCCVPFCDTRVGEVDSNGNKVRFHRIPLIPEKFLHWRNQITSFGKYKPDPALTVNSRVCSKHFLQDDYITMEEQKPETAGNHVLAKNAVPSIFKWTDEKQAGLSRAVPFVKKSELQSMLNDMSKPSKHQAVQCSLEEEALKEELHRKNCVIRQLLQKLSEIESGLGEKMYVKTLEDSAGVVRKKDLNLNLNLEQLHIEGKQEQDIFHGSETGPNESCPSPPMPKLIPSVSVVVEPPNEHRTTPILRQGSDCDTTTSSQAVFQRESVIRHISSTSCSSSADNDVIKPPKKRKLNLIYNYD